MREEASEGKEGPEMRRGNRDKVHLREAMVATAESEGDEEGHGNLRGDANVRRRGGIRGITDASVREIACEKKRR